MAVFGAAVIKEKKWAFILVLVSMFFSDALIQVLYYFGVMKYGGFYSGQTFYDSQILNYSLLAALTLFGFWARNLNFTRIAAATITAPVMYFLASNFLVWIGGAGLSRPKTFSGLVLCYEDALPFFRTTFFATIAFSIILFGGYFLIRRFLLQKQLA